MNCGWLILGADGFVEAHFTVLNLDNDGTLDGVALIVKGHRTGDAFEVADGGHAVADAGPVDGQIADIEAFEQQQLRTRTDLPANPTIEEPNALSLRIK